MITLLITSFLILAALAYCIYLWQRPASAGNLNHVLNARVPRSLFDEGEPIALPQSHGVGDVLGSGDKRAGLLAKAVAGDKQALWQADGRGDRILYGDVLDVLVERAGGSDKQLFALVSYIGRSEKLRANIKLSKELMEVFRKSPEKRTAPQVLHIAALSDDAATYHAALEIVLEALRAGLLPNTSVEDLRVLIESEYWVLSEDARRSGAGFVLKRRLAALRRDAAKDAGSA